MKKTKIPCLYSTARLIKFLSNVYIKSRKPELQALLNNTVDDDEAILLRRELEGEEATDVGA